MLRQIQFKSICRSLLVCTSLSSMAYASHHNTEEEWMKKESFYTELLPQHLWEQIIDYQLEAEEIYKNSPKDANKLSVLQDVMMDFRDNTLGEVLPPEAKDGDTFAVFNEEDCADRNSLTIKNTRRKLNSLSHGNEDVLSYFSQKLSETGWKRLFQQRGWIAHFKGDHPEDVQSLSYCFTNSASENLESRVRISKTLKAILKNNTTLEHLHIPYDQYLDNKISQIYMIKKGDTAEVQIIYKNSILKALEEALEENVTLKTLSLRGNISDQETQFLSRILKKNKGLETLKLQESKIGNNSLKDLAKALRSNKALKQLDLSNNGFGISELKSFFKATQRNKTLERVIVKNLDRDPKSLTRLRRLSKSLKKKTPPINLEY